jgi:hypothetical protein
MDERDLNYQNVISGKLSLQGYNILLILINYLGVLLINEAMERCNVEEIVYFEYWPGVLCGFV